jgi:transposase
MLMETIELQFLYKHTSKLYGSTGNPSIDPVVFFKLMLTGYLKNITSDTKLVEHCAMRMDILYFLGYDIDEQLPWHSTINRTRQLYPGEVFEMLFNKVFTMCVQKGMVSGHTQAVDSAPVKANASMESIELKNTFQSIERHFEIVDTENQPPALTPPTGLITAPQHQLSRVKKHQITSPHFIQICCTPGDAILHFLFSANLPGEFNRGALQLICLEIKIIIFMTRESGCGFICRD